MELLLFILGLLIRCYLTCFDFLIFGFVMYGLGCLFKWLWLKRLGFMAIAFGDAPICGTHAKWLSRNCCLNRDCSKCPYWTCLGKQEKDYK